MGEAQEPLVQWVAQVRKILDYRRPEGNAGKIPRVATHLLNEKREVYIPHYVSLGPYYHWQLEKEIAASSASVGGSYENREMMSPAEAYKVQSAATFWRRRPRILDDIVENIRGKLEEIEEFYNWPISRDGEYPQQFALMMAIDSSFLLRFLLLQSGGWKHNGDLGRLKRVDEVSVKCDILKLENQIPLPVLSSVFNEALGDDYNFSNLLQMTCKELSPFEQFDIEKNDTIARINEQTHLLGCVHAFVSPLLNIIDQDNVPEWSPRRTLFQRVKSFYQLLLEDHRPSNGPERTQRYQRMLSLFFFPSQYKYLRERVQYFLEVLLAEVSVKFGRIRPPSNDILNSYNAETLEKCGIKFKSFSKQPYGIRFDKYAGTLYLPRVTVSEMQTEVLFRNLLALEFNEEDAARGDSVMRYVGLMDCLIGTPEDVRLLRESRVILPRSLTLTDEKIAGMWNSMCHPIFTDHLDPPDHLKRALDEVLTRKYYIGTTRAVLSGPGGFMADEIVKVLGFLSAPIRERLSDPGKGAAMLVGILILVMTAIQTYCALATYKNF